MSKPRTPKLERAIIAYAQSLGLADITIQFGGCHRKMYSGERMVCTVPTREDNGGRRGRDNLMAQIRRFARDSKQ